MKLNKDADGDIQWFDSLDDAKEDGYYPVKATSLLQFFILKGKTIKILKENLESIRYLYYVVYAGSDKRYYFRLFRHCLLEDLFFYVHDNKEMQHLRKFVEDGTVTLLMTKQQVMDTTALLTRLWSANLTGEGKLPYKIYLQIMEKTLLLEDYKGHGRELTGFKTVCNKMELEIADLWRKASEVKVDGNGKGDK